MNSVATNVRSTTLAILSLLDEPADRNAATRRLRGDTVLKRTIDRLSGVSELDGIELLAWSDQLPAIALADIGDRASVRDLGPRRPTAAMLARAAALRWCDGWRGGLLSVCEFDRGFCAEGICAAMDGHAAGNVLLISASAALIDADAIGRILSTLRETANEYGYAFAAGTPGSGAMAITRETIDELRRLNRGPGALLAYHPDRARHDPLAKSPSVTVSPTVARSLVRISVDSERQTHRLSLAQADADGLDAAARVARLSGNETIDAMPRDVVLELTARRLTRPIFSPLAKYRVDRADLTLDAACRLFDQLACVDDVRLTLAGVGDPLLHDDFGAILDAARERGIAAIHVETDLLTDRAGDLVRATDLVSVHLPAAFKPTYLAAMGVDRIDEALAQIKALLIARNATGGALPIIVPTFAKLAINVGEMEQWYDQWIRALGAATIIGPSTFGGTVQYAGVADMTPPARVACRSLRARIVVQSDGAIVACEQDVFARHRLGSLDEVSLAEAWQTRMQPIRNAHATGDWAAATASCGACRMWDRP